MTVPLLRVCYHCGYPTPGRHASSCRDKDSGVVEVAKPLVPADVAQQIRDVEAQRDGLAELLKGAVDAGERYQAEASGLRQELDEARRERDAARSVLASAREDPDWDPGPMVMLYDQAIDRAEAAEAERDRMRPVVEAADALMDFVGGLTAPLPPGTMARLGTLAFALDATRAATPDAEPAPRVWTMPEIPDGVRRVRGRHDRLYERREDEPGWNRIDLPGASPAPVPYNDGELIVWCGPLVDATAEPAPGVPAVQVEPFHTGRSWSGNELEAECPCPKEACGLVDLSRAVPECTQHPITRGKTMRQGHPADKCPALPAPGVPVDTEATP